jgi:hypothetical protein
VAACLAPRVRALALISPVGPVADSGCGPALPRFQRFSFTRLPRLPLVTASVFRIFRWSLNHAPRLAAQLATLRGSRADKQRIARPDICDRLLGSFREGLRPGVQGPVIDLAIFSRPWRIDLSAIEAPTSLWIGTKDNAVPVVAARALAGCISGCALQELPDEGHLWIAEHYDHVLEWLADATRGRRLGAA